MGFLNIFAKPAPKLLRLPSGSFTVDREARVLASTLPHTFPRELLEDIARQVLAACQSVKGAQLNMSEMIVRYSSLKITARELGGGAIIFLTPQTLSTATQ